MTTWPGHQASGSRGAEPGTLRVPPRPGGAFRGRSGTQRPNVTWGQDTHFSKLTPTSSSCAFMFGHFPAYLLYVNHKSELGKHPCEVSWGPPGEMGAGPAPPGLTTTPGRTLQGPTSPQPSLWSWVLPPARAPNAEADPQVHSGKLRSGAQRPLSRATKTGFGLPWWRSGWESAC